MTDPDSATLGKAGRTVHTGKSLVDHTILRLGKGADRNLGLKKRQLTPGRKYRRTCQRFLKRRVAD
jgi:hypothetical protein